MTVELVEELGADAYVHGSVRVGKQAERFVVRADGCTPPKLGETVKVAIASLEDVYALHADTGLRLPTG
ncbi:hypothetical protein GCM10009676_08810 [Prauserella halophila]|uniref:TRAM domain-containing protein n=1 Tax=Prauserella halophila TaxID=185641 RepID=A0ABN1W0D5_9PSEU|nr:hypothetical protein [Prauserella halophila]